MKTMVAWSNKCYLILGIQKLFLLFMGVLDWVLGTQVSLIIFAYKPL